jgi:hypothetical protein
VTTVYGNGRALELLIRVGGRCQRTNCDEADVVVAVSKYAKSANVA